MQELKNATPSVEGLEYKILPYIDQSDMYGAVYHRLLQGGSIAIFPEGGFLISAHKTLRPLLSNVTHFPISQVALMIEPNYCH